MISTIDLSPLLHSSASLEELTSSEMFTPIAYELGEAARGLGALQVVGHGVPRELIDQTYQVSSDFFSCSLPEKMRYYIGDYDKHRGYVPLSERGDYLDERARSYESLDFGLDLSADDPLSLSHTRLLGPNLWPETVGIKAAVSAYYKHMERLSLVICSLFERYLGVSPGVLTQQMRRPISQLRLLSYQRPPGVELPSAELSAELSAALSAELSAELSSEPSNIERSALLIDEDWGDVNMGAHTDYECFTLVHQNAPGLQILNTSPSASQAWIDVPTQEEAIFINIGDLLEVWSNGVLTSTLHRVVNRAPKRQSLVYFAATDYDVIVTPLASQVTPERPAQYEALHAGQHLERMLRRDFPYLCVRDQSLQLEIGSEMGSAPPQMSSFELRAHTAYSVHTAHQAHAVHHLHTSNRAKR